MLTAATTSAAAAEQLAVRRFLWQSHGKAATALASVVALAAIGLTALVKGHAARRS